MVNKRLDSDGEVEYLVKWEGYPDSENTWEPESEISENCQQHIQEYEKNNKYQLLYFI